MTVEDIPPATRKVVTRSPSHTVRLLHLNHLQKEPIEADSSVERDFVYCCSLYPHTVSITSQPFKLKLLSGSYTPDYLVNFSDGSKAVIEVKPEKFISKYEELFNEVTDILKRKSVDFIVARDTVLRNDGLADRAVFIRRYGKQPINLDLYQKCVEILRDYPEGITIKKLKKVGITKECILNLVANRKLQLESNLNFDDNNYINLTKFDSKGKSHALCFASWLNA